MTVVQRKFDFTRLAQSALLDDFELVTRVQHADDDASDTCSSAASSPPHSASAAAGAAAAAAGADRRAHLSTTLDATANQRRGVAFLEPISKHMYVITYTA